ncbi:hypothetical protein HUZ36_12955 [Pseudoalteromonas sp. McH1-7]|uniref:hypothetical protein n=1 Tax=Pseudoalteromonas TaxID=53246 RepID=UPI0015919DFE|nr:MULTISPECIES: hypothetical protein [Pseudoalteromonas]MDW7550139.1 hypothetical protein [Pseudoalteromonas peptidolytica]NUZ11689.1 hypothetical protein [Pseudoalteromonas sp. McH1-7]USD29526.1 hypothetical protein J8Z24_05430 [Pseudoalteromonas sp. SCSIO 43201]
MKKFFLISTLLVIVCIAAVFFALQRPMPPSPTPALQATPPLNASAITPTPKAATAQATASKKQPLIDALPLAQAAQSAAAHYEYSISLPPYSQPLGKGDFDRLNPNHFYAVTMLLEDTNQQVSLTLNQYRFIHPATIEVSLSGSQFSSAVATIVDPMTQQTIATSRLIKKAEVWQGEIAGQADWPPELNIQVRANPTNAKPVALTANARYYQPSATLLTIAQPYPHKSDLVIPLQLEVKQSGSYRIRANLFTPDGTPVSHLVEKQKLSEGKQVFHLKAHHSVLEPFSAKSGPSRFTLKTFVIEKMSPMPGKRAQFGDSKVSEYEITDFYFDALERQPYQPSAAEQQRLSYLQKMAGN